jgi:hypothetical protein
MNFVVFFCRILSGVFQQDLLPTWMREACEIVSLLREGKESQWREERRREGSTHLAVDDEP